MARVRVPASIPADFSVDVTADLNSLIADHPDDTMFLFRPGSQYRVDGTIHIQGRNGITFYGEGGDQSTERGAVSGVELRAFTNGDELVDPDLIRDRHLVRLTDGSRFSLYNMTLRGANPNAGTGDSAYVLKRESQHCIAVRGTDGVLLDRVTCHDPYGDYLYIGRSVSRVSSNVTCRRFHFERNGRQGIGIVAGTDIDIYDGWMGHNRRAAIDIEPNDATQIKRIRFRNFTIGPTRLNFFSNVGHPAAEIEDITFEYLLATGSAGPDFAESRLIVTSGNANTQPGKRLRYAFRYCRSTRQHGSPSGNTMNIHHVTDLKAIGCTQPMEAGRNMFLLIPNFCTTVRVVENTLLNAELAMSKNVNRPSTDYCAKNNQIGNPLRWDVPEFECP